MERWITLTKLANGLDPRNSSHLNLLRAALLDFIADFANWDHSTVKEYPETSRALTQAAHEALGGEPGTKPLVVDPFAGGGSIPLESLRVGADAFASDLNPVAVLLNKVVLEYIPKYGQRLADEVRKFGIIVFAHKSTAGWEAQLQAMIDAGWIMTGSWPIDTEMGTRLRAIDSAALASSVHLVCRPRENPDGSVRTDEIGDWRDVLQELPRRIHEWMPRLAEEGVVGADATFACLGPALEIFSQYARVEKASGEQVWTAVAKEALNMIFEGADATGFGEDARLTAM